MVHLVKALKVEELKLGQERLVVVVLRRERMGNGQLVQVFLPFQVVHEFRFLVSFCLL